MSKFDEHEGRSDAHPLRVQLENAVYGNLETKDGEKKKVN